MCCVKVSLFRAFLLLRLISVPHIKVSLFMAFLPYRLVNVPCQGQFIQGFSSIQADKCATHEGQSVQGFSPIQADKCAKHQGQFIQGFLSYSGWYVCHVKISVF